MAEPETGKVDLGLGGPEIITDSEALLQQSRILRQQIMHRTMGSEDPKMIKLALTAMKDNDAQVLTIKRIESDDANAKSDRETAKSIHEMNVNLRRMTGNVNPFERQDGNAKQSGADEARGTLPEIEIQPGQMDIGASNETYADFMKKFEEPES